MTVGELKEHLSDFPNDAVIHIGYDYDGMSIEEDVAKVLPYGYQLIIIASKHY